MTPSARVVVDTGVLLAAADADDRWNDRAADVLTTRRANELIVPAPVAAETSWMIGSRLGSSTEAAFVASIAAGDLAVVELSPEDWVRCAELIGTYADLRLGLVDASVIAVAERFGLTTVATIDRRDFLVVRPRHCEAFDLIP